MTGTTRLMIIDRDPDFIIFKELKLGKGSSLPIKDYRNFTPHEFKENGDQVRKGRVSKS